MSRKLHMHLIVMDLHNAFGRTLVVMFFFPEGAEQRPVRFSAGFHFDRSPFSTSEKQKTSVRVCTLVFRFSRVVFLDQKMDSSDPEVTESHPPPGPLLSSSIC